MYVFQGPRPLDKRDQCASFEPLVVQFGKAALTAGQSGLSALGVAGSKTYDTMVQDNPGKNTCQDPPAEKKIDRKQNKKPIAPSTRTYDLSDNIHSQSN